jgi:glycosyltransferase involved in cell wall biosynthesis
MTAQPLVSVIIANFNYGRFLPDCLESIFAQTYQPIEVVVVDDGSTDDSREVLENYRARIKTVWQSNAGQAAALSAGFEQCKGEIICLLDADDGWYPHKVRRLVDTFAAYPDVDWIRHKLACVSDELQPYNRLTPPFNGSARVRPDPALLIERIVAAGTSLAMRRSLAQRVFPLRLDADMQVDADDTLLLARVFAAGATGYSLDEVLGFYRRHRSHRFGLDDVNRLLNHQAEVATVLARMFGSARVPVAAYKHYTIVAALRGASWWHRERLGNYMNGLRSAIALWNRPALCARQTAALTFAFVAPMAWLERLKRAQPFFEEDVAQKVNEVHATQ